MATLVLTTIGTAIGGPIGGAIGAVLGQQVDQRFLAPRGQGARLGALTVQTSAYGQPIPKLFGTMRVAGTVIWATDLKEDRTKSGGSKGKPKTTTYSYSASFAVALSGRPIRAVHRIWADGKLLRGAAGDWKSETGFRLHRGDEAQVVDPLIAAAEGAGGTPAYRGIAYAVFEDMQLADYGNRIPSLTFEVEADAAAVSLGEIAAALSDGAAAGATTAMLGGYAAGGDSVRAALETLAQAIPLTISDDGNRLRVRDDMPALRPLPASEFGATTGTTRADRRLRERQASGTLPDEVTITYYEPARDYQAGLQRARRGGASRRIETIELAAALEAGAAKAAAERRLADAWAARETATATLPWRRLDLRPGDGVDLDDGRRWRIAGWTLEAMVLSLKLRGTSGTAALPPSAEHGRPTIGADAVHGPTTVALLDLPPLLDDGGATPRLWLAAAGASPGWRRAAVIASSDGGASWADAGATAAPTIMGMATSALAAGEETIFDDRATVVVRSLNDAMTLLSRTDDAVVNGANAAMIGDELIQFGHAERLGDGSWRLSRLLRGRRGTEAAMAGHVPGERFVLIEAETLLPIEVSADRIGGTLMVIASGVGDPVGVAVERVVSGRATRPPAPVQLRAQALAGGGIRLAWTRRSRAGWAWTDGGDVPLGEDAERYRLTLTSSSGAARTMTTDQPFFDYDAGLIAADRGVAGAIYRISVVQLGTYGASDASAWIDFDGNGAKI